MAVDVNAVAKRVIELLLAAGRASRYTAVAGDNARYAVTQEILDAILEADANVCRAICETPGHSFASTFLTDTDALESGEEVPGFAGGIVDVKVDGTSARLASSRGEILEVAANSALYPDIGGWYFVENSILFHTGTGGVVRHAAFSMTDACQAHESYRSAVVAGAVMLLAKDGGDPAFYQHYVGIFAQQERAIRGGQMVVPEATAYEQLAA